MRALPVVLLLLAGCASAPADDVDHSQPLYDVEAWGPTPLVEDTDRTNATWGNDTSRLIAQGAVRWHGDPSAPLNAYSQVAQIVAHPCAWEPREVYFTNQLIGAFEMPYGTDEVGVTFTWELTNTPSMELRAAWRSGDKAYAETSPFVSGTTYRIAQNVTDWQDEFGPFAGKSWELWACLPDDTGDSASLYIGELDFRVDAYRID